MATESKHTLGQCCRMMWRGYHETRCQRKAAVEVNGNGYCKQHEPRAVAARREKSLANGAAKWQAQNKRRRLELAAPELLSALKDLINADLNSMGYHSARETAKEAIAKAEGQEGGK